MTCFIILILIAAAVFLGVAAVKWKMTAIAFSYLMTEKNFNFSENELRRSMEYAAAHLFRPIRKD